MQAVDVPYSRYNKLDVDITRRANQARDQERDLNVIHHALFPWTKCIVPITRFMGSQVMVQQ